MSITGDWIGGTPGKDYSIEAEPVSEYLRNTLVILDSLLAGDRTRTTDEVDTRLALAIVRGRLWDAIQRLEGAA